MKEEAKKHAIDLMSRYWHECNLTRVKAKQCASLAVDLIIGAMPKYPSKNESISPNIDAVTFWAEVKQEIEKLPLTRQIK